MDRTAKVVIVGTGAAGLFCALHLPEDWPVLLITKSDLESSDSFLAQGGICMLHDEADYESYFEDTMKAGHYENRRESVDLMIRSSQSIIHALEGFGVDSPGEQTDGGSRRPEGDHLRGELQHRFEGASAGGSGV